MATDVADWDDALEDITRSTAMAPLNLLRTISDAFSLHGGNGNGGARDDDGNGDGNGNDDDLDLVLEDVLSDIVDADNAQSTPHVVSYASSDDTASESHSIQHSCSSSEYEEPSSTIMKKRAVRRRTTAGLSAQEKSQRRKERNRELAAESRKRKNDEMERLRVENAELKQRVDELEKRLAMYEPSSAKRSRANALAGVSAVAMSLTAFVLAGPAEHSSSTASVVLTALDSVDGQMGDFLHFIFTGLLVALLVCGMAVFSSSKHKSSPSAKRASVSSSKGLLGQLTQAFMPDALLPATMTV